MTAISRRDVLRVLALGTAGAGRFDAQLAAGEPMLKGEAVDTESIQTRRLGTTDIPVIGLGTWQTFDVGRSTEERLPLEEVLRVFVSMGGSLIDTSPMYGASEEVVGDLASKLSLHPKLFFAGKVWTAGKSAGIKQMDTSKQHLHVKRVDLMQVHNLVDVTTHLDTLTLWKREGYVRYVGVTHYADGYHDAVTRVMQSHPLDAVQINYSAGEREAEQRLLPIARERGIAVIANRPFAGGDLLRRLRGTPLPAWATEIDCTTWAQILLKFVVSHPAITCAIPATADVSHLRDNMRAGYGRMPDEALRRRISDAVG